MTQSTWSLTVGDDGVLEIPPEVLETTGWTEDTLLEWSVEENGSISFKAVEPEENRDSSSQHEDS